MEENGSWNSSGDDFLNDVARKSMVVLDPAFWSAIMRHIDVDVSKEVADDLYKYLEKYGRYSVWDVVYGMFIVLTLFVGSAIKETEMSRYER